ncbi:hypothetical protein TNCV_1618331 [Trichonephila clavipes]|nr:hypothetical protein TNCV_1618331 [Trichonephila clavipes]
MYGRCVYESSILGVSDMIVEIDEVIEQVLLRCGQDIDEGYSSQSIKSNIKERYNRISDCWKAYDCLEHEVFLRLSVNYSMYLKIQKRTRSHRNSNRGFVGSNKKSAGTHRCKDQDSNLTLRSTCGER